MKCVIELYMVVVPWDVSSPFTFTVRVQGRMVLGTRIVVENPRSSPVYNYRRDSTYPSLGSLPVVLLPDSISILQRNYKRRHVGGTIRMSMYRSRLTSTSMRI